MTPRSLLGTKFTFITYKVLFYMIQFYFFSSISYHFTMQELPKFSCFWKYATSVHSHLLFPTCEIPIHCPITGKTIDMFQVPIQLCPLWCFPAPAESKFASHPPVSLCSRLHGSCHRIFGLPCFDHSVLKA